VAIRTISIVGVGLIGGSFALGLRKAGFDGRIIGVSSPATISAALQIGVIDEGLAMADALPKSDLIYLAQPVARILEQLAEVAKLAPAHALVTDAGSTKEAIVKRAGEVFGPGGATFVGGHPMAGKEGRGVSIAEADLFHGATYILTAVGADLPASNVLAEFRALLADMGCRERVMDAATHDRVVAWTSHLPQLVSTALADSVLQNVGSDDDLKTAGDGLRDMTRLAASPYQMWDGILSTNESAIDAALVGFIEKLEELRAAAKARQASECFERARGLREKLMQD